MPVALLKSRPHRSWSAPRPATSGKPKPAGRWPADAPPDAGPPVPRSPAERKRWKRERRRQVKERDWYRNELFHVEGYARLVELVASLDEPTPTSALLAEAGVPHEEGLGALKMLEVEERCYSTSGGRSQLMWMTGVRPPGVRMPRLVERDRPGYLALRSEVRRCSGDWISTDGLMIAARFPARLRKAVRGALKALVALGLVEWRHYSIQAITWHWIGPGGGSQPFRRRYQEVSLDDPDVAAEVEQQLAAEMEEDSDLAW